MNDNSHVALITGGGSGIGAAVARQLLSAGGRVAVTGRSEQRLFDFAAQLGHPEGLLTIPGSAAEYDEVQAAVETTLRTIAVLAAPRQDRFPGAASLHSAYPITNIGKTAYWKK